MKRDECTYTVLKRENKEERGREKETKRDLKKK